MAQDSIRYICPICDQEIRAGSHFCRNCKRFVRDPWRYTGGHLPNEAHQGCHPMQSFMRPRENGTEHSASSKNRSHTFGRTFTQKSASPKSTAPRNIYQQSSTQRSVYQQNSTQRSGYRQSGSQREHKSSGVGALITVLIIFWFIIQIIFNLAL